MGVSLFSCSGGTTRWKAALCAGEQARASGFAAELLSLGLPLHPWLLSLRSAPFWPAVPVAAQAPVCGQGLPAFPFPDQQGKL